MTAAARASVNTHKAARAGSKALLMGRIFDDDRGHRMMRVFMDSSQTSVEERAAVSLIDWRTSTQIDVFLDAILRRPLLRAPPVSTSQLAEQSASAFNEINVQVQNATQHAAAAVLNSRDRRRHSDPKVRC